jgi:LysM repeat protein
MKNTSTKIAGVIWAISASLLCMGLVSCRTPTISKDSSVSGLPPFYDKNNIAEYYGRCPKCNSWVKGYMTFWDGFDSKGNLCGGSGILGHCTYCNADLEAKCSFEEEDRRIVHWRLQLQSTEPASPLAPNQINKPTVAYIVQKGDTLFQISKKYGISVDDIAKTNNLTNPNFIKIGQNLIIPIPKTQTQK